MFSYFRFHFLSRIEFAWQLLNLKTVFICYFMSHASILIFLILRFFVLLVVVIERNFWVALVRGYFSTIDGLLVSHVHRVDILRMFVLFLTLPWMDYTLCLNICFLTRWSSSRGNTLTICYWVYRIYRIYWFTTSPLGIVRIWIWVEIISSSRKWW